MRGRVWSRSRFRICTISLVVGCRSCGGTAAAAAGDAALCPWLAGFLSSSLLLLLLSRLPLLVLLVFFQSFFFFLPPPAAPSSLDALPSAERAWSRGNMGVATWSGGSPARILAAFNILRCSSSLKSFLGGALETFASIGFDVLRSRFTGVATGSGASPASNLAALIICARSIGASSSSSFSFSLFAVSFSLLLSLLSRVAADC
mmetsp:Transcript_2685/g.7393  ORF Transcript_2685/g.7393 Transcript_2685/m.7393 type:complete len:204 (-) Transcript_2685:1086-1697(-)